MASSLPHACTDSLARFLRRVLAPDSLQPACVAVCKAASCLISAAPHAHSRACPVSSDADEYSRVARRQRRRPVRAWERPARGCRTRECRSRPYSRRRAKMVPSGPQQQPTSIMMRCAPPALTSAKHMRLSSSVRTLSKTAMQGASTCGHITPHMLLFDPHNIPEVLQRRLEIYSCGDGWTGCAGGAPNPR